MHCVLGVTKMLLKLWFDSEHHSELWYCRAKIEEANSKMMQIKPPLILPEFPEALNTETIGKHQNVVLGFSTIYSFSVMFNILPAEYIAHHILLVETVHTLLHHCIRPAMLKKAEKLIQHYFFKLQYYYLECFMTANVYHLLHIP